MQGSRLAVGVLRGARHLSGETLKPTFAGEILGQSLLGISSGKHESLKRNFFNKLFGRGPTAQEEEPIAKAPSIITERRKESSYEKDSYKKTTPMSEEEAKFLKKKEEFLQSLAKKRDAQDSEIEKRKKEIEEASTASRREFDITLASLDYGKIIQDNMAINRETSFESVDELVNFIARISNAKIKLTEENIVKVLHGYISYAPVLGREAAQSREFAYLLNLLRTMIGALSQTESLTSIVAFLDLYCVDYPELWVKVEQRILSLRSTLPVKELLEILRHTSNQGEGTEYFYDQMEKRFAAELGQMSVGELALALQVFFNVRRGTKDFVASVFERIVQSITPETDITTMTKVTLAVSEATEDMIPVSSIYEALDKWVTSYKGEISLEQACLLGFAFGPVHGSDTTFKKLEKVIADKNENIGLEELKLVLRGFVFNLRISKNLLKAFKKKILGYQMELTPVEMAKILRAQYSMNIEDKEISSTFLNHILVSLQQYSHLLSEDDFYEVFFSMHKTRQGSREMYRTLDYILSLRLPEIIKDTQLARKIYAVAGTSGLTDPELLRQLAASC